MCVLFSFLPEIDQKGGRNISKENMLESRDEGFFKALRYTVWAGRDASGISLFSPYTSFPQKNPSNSYEGK